MDEARNCLSVLMLLKPFCLGDFAFGEPVVAGEAIAGFLYSHHELAQCQQPPLVLGIILAAIGKGIESIQAARFLIESQGL